MLWNLVEKSGTDLSTGVRGTAGAKQDARVIEPSTSPWASPIVLVQKK